MSETTHDATHGALRAQIVRYLDGVASADERATVERALLGPEAATIIAEELALRDLLRQAPPLDPPPALVARWEAAVLDVVEQSAAPADAEGRGWLDRALDAVGWSVRGPALSVTAVGTAPARSGLSTLRYGVPVRRAEPKPPLWRRLLALGLERRDR